MIGRLPYTKILSYQLHRHIANLYGKDIAWLSFELLMTKVLDFSTATLNDAPITKIDAFRGSGLFQGGTCPQIYQ